MTNVDYIHQRRNGNQISVMILIIWLVSIVISVAPILGWRDSEFHNRIANQQCLISQDVIYQIFATCSCFYVPLLLILLLYWRIYQVSICSLDSAFFSLFFPSILIVFATKNAIWLFSKLPEKQNQCTVYLIKSLS